MTAHLPGLDFDPWTLLGTIPDADENGIPLTDPLPYATGRGTFGELSARDKVVATQAGQQHDAVLATQSKAPFAPGMSIEMNGETWHIVAVQPTRILTRVLLRRGANDNRAA